jgi:hypothetical protein
MIEKDGTQGRNGKIGGFLKNSFSAIIKGEFLLRIQCGKYFIHIIYTFFLFWVSIWLSMKIEKTLTKVEDNKIILNDLEIYHAQKTVELVSLNRLTTVQQLLLQDSSKVTIPEKPAVLIKKR